MYPDLPTHHPGIYHPIESMGLVYLPTYTIHIQPFMYVNIRTSYVYPMGILCGHHAISPPKRPPFPRTARQKSMKRSWNKAVAHSSAKNLGKFPELGKFSKNSCQILV